MAPPRPATSPYLLYAAEDIAGRFIRITITFNATTRAVTGVTVFRDADCQWTTILIGRGADGSPNSTTRRVDVPAGTTNLTQQQLNALAGNGLATIEDFLALQVTAA